jgi:hypothetical protein
MTDDIRSRHTWTPHEPGHAPHLEVVREPAGEMRTERPHCDQHFLFTSDCAACIEAKQAVHTKPAPKNSRSFGYTDKITAMTFVDPYRTYGVDVDRLILNLVDDIREP